MSTRSSSMGQQHLPGELRRSELVSAAIRVMRRQGLLETTTRDVAAEAGVSPGLVHHYFKSQDDLVAEAFAEVANEDLTRVSAAVQASAGSVDRLATLVDAFTPPDAEWPFLLWIDAWAAAARHESVRIRSRSMNLRWVELFEQTFSDGVKDGVFDCPEPRAAAWRMLALLDGIAIQVVTRQTDISRATVAIWVHEAARREAGLAEL
ncbi:MAG: TetR family transcriptional regulator C-terminal domain-containing protein [Acidimicrobiales bacterium]